MCDAGVQFLGSRADEGSSSSDEELVPSDDCEADDSDSPQPRSAKRTPAKRKLQVWGWSPFCFICCRMVHACAVPLCDLLNLKMPQNRSMDRKPLSQALCTKGREAGCWQAGQEGPQQRQQHACTAASKGVTSCQVG